MALDVQLINLRYHIVSLVAVFLALSLGIVMGSTVIDKAIVDGLRDRVDSVSKRADSIDKDNKSLRNQLGTMQSFADEARDQLVDQRLKGVPVLVVMVQGVDRKPVETLRNVLATADATPAGTLQITNKMRLENDNDARALATALTTTPAAAGGTAALRRMALSRLAAAIEGPSSLDATLLPALAAGGFIGYEPPSPATTTTTLGLVSFPVPGLRVVLVSGTGAEVDDSVVAVPLSEALVTQVQNLGTSPAGRLVAAESGNDNPGGRAVFVGPLRADATVSQKLSTVDNLETSVGQAAVVLALDDLGAARTGHYGVGPAAQRLLPSLLP